MALCARRTLFVAALFVVACGQVARRFREGGRFFYMISDFALTDPADYTTSTTKSACLCRRRCEVLPNCSSVSLLPAAAGVECRVSARPADLSQVSARPRLSKHKGALHILATVEQEWKDPEADGLIYTLDLRPSTWSQTGAVCKAGQAAVATTWLQFDILRKYLDSLDAGTGMIIELCQYCFKGDKRPITWGYVNRVPYPDTELNMSLVVDPNPGGFAAYHMDKIGSEYKFIGTDAKDSHPTLCQDNDLNLEL